MITLRDETPDDHGAIAALVTEAFRTAPHAAGTEAAIVGRLREADGLLLSILAEEEGLVGQIAASPATVGGHAGWVAIGPVAVAPSGQGRGIGTALMEAALARLRAAGAPGVVLVGDPAFYRRFGFGRWDGLVVSGIPSDYVLALPFGAATPRGTILFHPAFGLA